MEEWMVGIMEYWNNGMMECCLRVPCLPACPFSRPLAGRYFGGSPGGSLEDLCHG